MVQNMAKVAKMARNLAIAHIIVGFLLICFGIGDRLVEFHKRCRWTGEAYFGIWIGIWMCITGGLGIPASRRERTRSSNAFAGVFMGFSITSAVLGGVIIICYSLSIASCRDRKERYDRNYRYYSPSYIKSKLKNYEPEMAISAMIIILGIVEFVIGIWTPICCCLMSSCACCVPRQQTQQVVYTANQAGYIMSQGPDGVPVAIPVQSGGGMFAIQAPGAQANQPPMVLVPVSGAAGGQHVMVQSPPHAAMSATGSLPQGAEKPPPYA